MTTLRERYGEAKAERMIEKAINHLLAFARKHGMHTAVAVLDAGGEDRIPDGTTAAAVSYRPHAGAALLCAQQIIDRALHDAGPEYATKVFNCMRAFIDAQEKEFWSRNDGEAVQRAAPGLLERLERELADLRGGCDDAAQILTKEIGAPGSPEHIQETAQRAVHTIASLKMQQGDLQRKLAEAEATTLTIHGEEIRCSKRLRDAMVVNGLCWNDALKDPYEMHHELREANERVKEDESRKDLLRETVEDISNRFEGVLERFKADDYLNAWHTPLQTLNKELKELSSKIREGRKTS